MRLDNTNNLVASYTIDRGRSVETERTDGGRATVAINDVDGVLDPTNGAGPYYGTIEPLLQVVLGRWNPILSEWQTRFRGFISDYDYSYDPSQRVNRLTLTLVDIFEILNVIKMQPDGTFGDDPSLATPDATGNVWFANGPAGGTGRIAQVMGNCAIDPAFYVAFTFNVTVHDTVYSPGESPLAVIQDCADAEFPNANVYPDRFGRLAAHGRLAKFDPATIAAGAGDEAWDWHHWNCGDGAAVAAAPSTTAQIRQFASNRGLAQVINQAIATPQRGSGDDLTGAEIAAQVVSDSTSIGKYGIRSWSRENLQTKVGLLDGSDDLTETKKYAQWVVDTHKDPRDRVTVLGFRSLRTVAAGAAITWKLMCECDIGDQIDITVASPGGGGFLDAPFFIEGVHETNEPLNPAYDNVTVLLDVSPQDYNTDPEGRFPTEEEGGGGGGGTGSFAAATSYSPGHYDPDDLGSDDFGWVEDAAPTVARIVTVTNQAQLEAAIADLTLGDKIVCSGYTTVTGEFTISGVSLGGYAQINFGTWTFTGVTGDTNLPSVYILNSDHLRITGGVMTATAGGAGFIIEDSSQISWYGYVTHDTRNTGGYVRPIAADCVEIDLQGEAYHCGLDVSLDPHAEDGTGLHGLNLADTDTGFQLLNSRFALYCHDQLYGAGVELGDGTVEHENVTVYLKGVNLGHDTTNAYGTGFGATFDATSQVAGNVIQFWGEGGTNLNLPYVEATNCRGRAVDVGGGVAPIPMTSSTCQYGRANNVCQNPNLGSTESGVDPDEAWDDRGSPAITYVDVATV